MGLSWRHRGSNVNNGTTTTVSCCASTPSIPVLVPHYMGLRRHHTISQFLWQLCSLICLDTFNDSMFMVRYPSYDMQLQKNDNKHDTRHLHPSWMQYASLAFLAHSTGGFQLRSLGRWNTCGTIRNLERAPNLIAEREDLSIVVNIMSVMYCMVLGSHYRINVEIHGIMNVGSPYSCEEQHTKVKPVVNWHYG